VSAVFFALPLPINHEIVMPVPVAQAAEPSQFPAAAASRPVRVSIPSIKLNSAVTPMGLTKGGDLDVPSGKTNLAGWYAAGTTPGEVGSAVLDAHVYAAFKNLHNVKVGQDIYVTMDSGATLHFKITEKKTLPLASISADEFYNDASGKNLHLITCAGTYSSKTATYSHRLLVYAALVQ
jgi:LPXTG-site transpeptidase (sortase) family protein